MKNIKSLKKQSVAENTDNNANSDSKNTKYNNEPINGLPIIARNINGLWFGTIGKYKATENFETFDELEEHTLYQALTWKEVAIIIAAQHDYMQGEIENLAREINNLQK